MYSQATTSVVGGVGDPFMALKDASGAPLGGEVIPEPLWMGQTYRTCGGFWSQGGFALSSGSSFVGSLLEAARALARRAKGPSRGAPPQGGAQRD